MMAEKLILDHVDHGSRSALAKCLKDIIPTNAWAWWYVPVIPAMQGSTIGKLCPDQFWHKMRPDIKNNQSKKGWQSGLSASLTNGKL
jgi:hypothetical protein